MLDGVQLDPVSFLARQLYSTAVSPKGRTFIGGIMTIIDRFLGIEPDLEEKISRSKQLDQATFEIMNFCKVGAGHLCWIYPGDRLLQLLNVDRTTLFYRANLCWVPGDDEVVQPTPHHPALILVK